MRKIIVNVLEIFVHILFINIPLELFIGLHNESCLGRRMLVSDLPSTGTRLTVLHRLVQVQKDKVVPIQSTLS